MEAGIAPLTVVHVAASPRVLLVDDDDFVAVSLRHYLTARGCEVEGATDRRAAEHLLRARSYDLVLVDPYMTGEASRNSGELLETIRASQPSARLLLITAYTSPQIVAAGEAHHAIAVLTKPQSVVFLSQLVMSALKSRRTS